VPLIHWGDDSAQIKATLFAHNKQQPTADAAAFALLCSAFNNFVVFLFIAFAFYFNLLTHKAR